jgi:hypothetical protein
VDVPNVAVAPRWFDEMDTFAPKPWSRGIGASPLFEGIRPFGQVSRNKLVSAHVLQLEGAGGLEAVMSGRRASTYIGIAVMGGVVGAIVGLLVAPGPGDETRRRIARHSIEDQERLLRLAEMGSNSDLLDDDSDLPASA